MKKIVSMDSNGQVHVRNNLMLAGSISESFEGERFYLRDASSSPIVTWVNQSTSANAEFFDLKYDNLSDNLGSSGHLIRALAPAIFFEVRGDGAGGHTIGSSFTSGHDTSCKDDDDLMPGLIVRSTGEMWAHPTTSFETALPFTELCQTNGSKDVFGVIAGHKPEYDNNGDSADPIHESYLKNGWVMYPEFMGYTTHYPTGSGNLHLHTNSIGEGSMWVTNVNGEIGNGDFIESSVIKGYGRLQGDDIMRSKTVAKCLETINWAAVTSSISYSGSAYKKHLAGVTFHCG